MNRFLILMYHRVRDDNVATNISVSTKNFERQMEYLKESFKLVSLENLVKNINSRTNSTMDAIAITFDDGYRDNYWNAFPILKKNGFPATVFVIHRESRSIPASLRALLNILPDFPIRG